MTATEDTRNQATAALHCAIDRVLDDAARQLHAAVQADVNAQALSEQYKHADLMRSKLDEARAILGCEPDCSLSDRVRAAVAEIERLRREVGILALERSDLRQSNHAYAKTLAGIQASIGRVEDDDLVEAARSLTAEMKRLIMQDILKRERAERAEAECELHREHITQLETESAARRKALEQIGEERRAEWTRAERAEAGRDRLLSAIRNYKAAVEGPNGVADAEAALFAWLEEIDHADCK